jgi:hypothetical protein
VIASEGAGWGTGQDLTRGRGQSAAVRREWHRIDQVPRASAFTRLEIDLFGKLTRDRSGTL